MKFSPKAFAVLGAGAVLIAAAGCSSQSSSEGGANQNAASGGDYNLSAVAQPANKGQALLSAINSATKSIDIVIYQIGGPEIPPALAAAMKKGVKVRVMIDGGTTGNATKGQAFVTQMQAAIAAASADASLFTAHWSSDNFNLTHQKSVMIDAVDSNGTTLASGSMPSTASLLISTGNFIPNVTPPEPFYGARDFYVTTPDQDLINRASVIFTSDFSCAGRDVTNNPYPGQNVGPQDDPKLVWSNGSTGVWTTDQQNEYPAVTQGYPFGYPPPATESKTPTDQGNSFDTQLNLIKGAKQGDTVRVYNEEMASYEVTQALIAAATPVGTNTSAGTPGQGANVQVVMSFSSTNGKPSSTVTSLEKIATAGGTVTMFADQNNPAFKDVLYIHAKIITVTSSDGSSKGFVGSENFSDPSMQFNRELGISLDSSTDQEVLGVLNNTFDTDFKTTAMTTQLTPANPTNIPASWLTAAKGFTSPQAQPNNGMRVGAAVQGCGPITVSAKK